MRYTREDFIDLYLIYLYYMYMDTNVRVYKKRMNFQQIGILL